MNSTRPFVSISCITYNHAKYIRDALEGFLMQKTAFPIEILIHDDASTDGTTEIVREYEEKHPGIIKPLYEKENQWSKGIRGSAIFNIPRALGKYIAICEGDDYWIDPYKLQKQVDYLEANPEYGICFTDAEILSVRKERLVQFSYKFRKRFIPSGDVLHRLIFRNPYITCTAMLLREATTGFSEIMKTQRFILGDWPLWLHIAGKYKVGYIADERTSVYRRAPKSASQFNSFEEFSSFITSINEIRSFFAKRYNLKVNRARRRLYDWGASMSFIVKNSKYGSFFVHICKTRLSSLKK